MITMTYCILYNKFLSIRSECLVITNYFYICSSMCKGGKIYITAQHYQGKQAKQQLTILLVKIMMYIHILYVLLQFSLSIKLCTPLTKIMQIEMYL